MKTLFLIATLTFLAGITTVGHAAKLCEKDQMGPLPECVKLVNKGSGKIKLQNYCEYDVDVIVDRSVDWDEREYLKAGHEKTIVSRATIKLSCCWTKTPECRMED